MRPRAVRIPPYLDIPVRARRGLKR